MAGKITVPTYVDYIPPSLERDPDGNPLCQCGRRADKLHCIGCGSLAVYNLASKVDVVRDRNGQEMSVPCYRCRRCGIIFNYYTFRNGGCESPRFIAKNMMEKRKAEAAREAVGALPEASRAELLQRLFADKEKPKDDPRLKL